ncbi:MAG TPA: hypothetical protein VGM90_02745 [Kofleriaceae bacterium]|jgi:uncharacterized membrane protein YjjB (DUF3815 family)
MFDALGLVILLCPFVLLIPGLFAAQVASVALQNFRHRSGGRMLPLAVYWLALAAWASIGSLVLSLLVTPRAKYA